MEFFARVLSGNSSLREADQINQTFKENLVNLKRLLESEESDINVLALLDMVYDSSFPEEQVFMKTPSQARLKSKKELVVRLLTGLASLGVPVMAEMLVFIRKRGPEEVADSLMTLLEVLSPLLMGKQVPDFSTDDVMDAMDFEWHSTSRVGSPLLNAIASATSSPQASAASIGDSPLHSASPYRRARSMLVSRAHELGAKSVLDRNSTASMAVRRSLVMSASSEYPSANQDFRLGQPTILEAAASPEIIHDSTDEKPSTYSLDTLPESSQHGLQRKHRRKSSSLQQRFLEDANDELSREGSVGSSAKRHSSSSSWRRNSSELTNCIDDAGRDGRPLEAEVHAVDGDDTLKPHEHELGLQSRSNGNVQEDARHVDTHEESHAEVNIHSSQEDAGQIKDDQSSRQEALEMKDGNSTGEELSAQKSSLVEGGNCILAQKDMPEPIREDKKKENAQPLDILVDNVSEPSAVAEHLKVSDDQFEKLISKLDPGDRGVFCESGEDATKPCWEASKVVSHPLNDNDHPQTSPQISVYASGGQCSESEPAGAQSPEAESTAPFTRSRMRWGRSLQVVGANESRPRLRDIRRSPGHFTERDPMYAGSFMLDNAADCDMHAGLMEDHEHQQANHAADCNHLHGHPTSSSTLTQMESQQQSDQPTASTMNRWDIVPRKGGWARGCLSCCSKPHTNP